MTRMAGPLPRGCGANAPAAAGVAGAWARVPQGEAGPPGASAAAAGLAGRVTGVAGGLLLGRERQGARLLLGLQRLQAGALLHFRGTGAGGLLGLAGRLGLLLGGEPGGLGRARGLAFGDAGFPSLGDSLQGGLPLEHGGIIDGRPGAELVEDGLLGARGGFQSVVEMVVLM